MSPGIFAILGVLGMLGVAEPDKIAGGIAACGGLFFWIMNRRRSSQYKLDNIQKGVQLKTRASAIPIQQALRNLNLELPMGELVALVGPTGAGKTSLAYLIPSLLTPESGRVLIDDHDVMDIDIDSLRRQVTYVFQEHILLSETIRENLLLANGCH